MRRRPRAKLAALMVGLAPLGALGNVSALAVSGPAATAATTAETLVHPPLSVLSVQRDAVTSTLSLIHI